MANNTGIYPFVVSSPATPLELFRILLSDDSPTPTSPVSAVGEYKYLSDAAATGLLSLHGDSPKRAAASQLETIALSEALMRKWSTDDLSLDGPATANALRLLARQWRDEADAEILGEDYFDITPTGHADDCPYGYAEGVILPVPIYPRWPY